MTNLDNVLKNQRHHFADKGPYSQRYGFFSSHLRLWELYHKEGWTLKNFAFQLTPRRSNQSILKEINPEYSLEGLMLKLKLQYFGHLMWRASSLEKTHAGKDWGQEEKGMTEEVMFRWHHHLGGGKFEQTPGDSKGQGSLACCSLWGCRQSAMTEQLNSNCKFSLSEMCIDTYTKLCSNNSHYC